jgi:hypothetical protein
MSSVMITLSLSDGALSDDGLSDGMVIKSDRIDGILPRGLPMLTRDDAFRGAVHGEEKQVDTGNS